eukprot:10416753-Lingulodinium_polyedra.AAC.1
MSMLEAMCKITGVKTVRTWKCSKLQQDAERGSACGHDVAKRRAKEQAQGRCKHKDAANCS